MNRRWVSRVWARRGVLGWIVWLFLLPASCLYYVVAALRNFCYWSGLLRAHRLPRPVVSVGNLTVGGTGKTPTTLWVAKQMAERGFKVAILSRGYKRRGRRPVTLEPGVKENANSTSERELLAVGDEPFMMARIYGQRVGVGKKREKAAEQLLQRTNVDVFLLDDGFQHRQVKRDVDLLLLGSDAIGWVLPSGPFRESKRAFRRADLYLVTDSGERWASWLPDDRSPVTFRGSLQAKSLLAFESNRWKECPLNILDRSKILTVTGIANPASFYQMIQDWEGQVVAALEFPDHHVYSANDWQRINRDARGVDYIITTEKDIVKLIRFPFARGKLLALRVAMVVENGATLIDRIVQHLPTGARN